LPLAAIRREDVEPIQTGSSSNAAEGAGPDLRGFHVLVIDDEADARALIQHILTNCNATVTTAASAAEGLDAVKLHRPHMIFSDIGMPRVDGYEFIAKLHQLSDAEGGNTPAVALTAFARSEDRRRALMAGFQMHLPKPVEHSEILAVASNIWQGALRRGKSP
jgi:CheY-like chemotaxis protein